MHAIPGMDDHKFEISRLELLTKLEENLETHRTIYKEAKAGYLVELRDCLVELGEKADMIGSHTDDNKLKADYRKLQDEEMSRLNSLDEPVSYAQAYVEMIEALRQDVRETIELTGSQFRCLWLDKWSWKNRFLASNAKYSQTARHLSPG